MRKLVTVGIPVYKRLNYLPEALRSVAAQDYLAIELLVSDNGQNGEKVPALVKQWYGRPFRVRQNATSVDCSSHYNQLIHEASGEYVLILGDDDEITPTLVSDLVQLLDEYPDAPVAIPRQEKMDELGRTLRSSSNHVPELLSGEEFIRGWCLYTYKFQTLSTTLMRTIEVKRCGGYPVTPGANGDEDLLMIKLCLGRSVAFSNHSTIRKREHEASLGLSCDYREFVKASIFFRKILDQDPIIRQYAQRHSDRWAEIKALLVKMSWEACLYRWKNMYRQRTSPLKWMLSAFNMPYIPEYYSAVMTTLMENLKPVLIVKAKQRLPWAYKIYRALRNGTS